MMRIIPWAAALLVALPVPAPQPTFALDPALPYLAQRGNEVTYQVDFAVVVTAPYHTKVLRVWLPLPPSNEVQQISGRQLSTYPLKVQPQIAREPVYGNEFACFQFDHPEGAQIIHHRFTVKVAELHWAMDLARVKAPASWPTAFEQYLRPQPDAATEPEFQAAVAEAVPNRQGEGTDVMAVMNWVIAHMTYDHNKASLRADAAYAAKSRQGHCSDYHGLCASMARSLNYPSRVTYGINLFAKNSPSHCKLEAFLPPYGWVSFDVSETQNLIRAIKADPKLSPERREKLIAAAVARLAGGFRDNTWLLLTRGTDYELAPKASAPVRVVRTAYVEADGVALPDPDPANSEKREFAWMTIHDYRPDRPVTYPFKDLSSLGVE